MAMAMAVGGVCMMSWDSEIDWWVAALRAGLALVAAFAGKEAR